MRPSTGTADDKESYQITLPHMDDLWPNQTLVPEFHRVMLDFEYRAWQLGMKVLSCFADRLGFERTSSPGPMTGRSRTTRAPCVCCTIFLCRTTTSPTNRSGGLAPTPTSTA